MEQLAHRACWQCGEYRDDVEWVECERCLWMQWACPYCEGEHRSRHVDRSDLGSRQYRMLIAPGGVKLTRERRAGERKPTSRTGTNDRAEVEMAAKRQALSRTFCKREITGYTAGSRRNLIWTVARVRWDDIPGRLCMVTLTYPAVFPMDGAVVTRHRDAFRHAWERAHGPMRALWVREFQERGAPHIHMYVGVPEDAKLVLRHEMRGGTWEWALGTWTRIAGGGDRRHARYGVNVRPVWYGQGGRTNAERIAHYFAKESGKYGQKRPPEGYVNVGRTWGVWRLPMTEHEVVLSRREFVEGRRPLRTLRDKKAGRKCRRLRGGDGLSVTGIDGLGVGVPLYRWAQQAAYQSRTAAAASRVLRDSGSR